MRYANPSDKEPLPTLAKAKKISAGMGLKTKYPTPGFERYLYTTRDGRKILLANNAGKLSVTWTSSPVLFSTEMSQKVKSAIADLYGD